VGTFGGVMVFIIGVHGKWACKHGSNRMTGMLRA
jgi:hypothetical protein